MSLAAAPLYGSCRPKRSLGGSRATPVRLLASASVVLDPGCRLHWHRVVCDPAGPNYARDEENRIRYYTKNVRWSVHVYLLGLYRFGWSALILHSHFYFRSIALFTGHPYCCEDDVGAIRNLAIDFNGFFFV